MQIVVSIEEVWLTHGQTQSRFLENLGLTVEDLVRYAFGFMVASSHPHTPAPRNGLTTHGLEGNLVEVVRRFIKDRLPTAGQSVYDVQLEPDDRAVHRVVDMIGEISHLMADSVTKQIGRIPAHLKLLRFTGPDIILQYHEDSSEYALSHSLAQGGGSRP